LPLSERINQLLGAQGQPVVIRQRVEGSVDEFNVPTYTWSDEATETCVLTSPTTKTFAELAWVYAGQMESRDRLGYFKLDSVIAEQKRVVLSSGERYEVDTIDVPYMLAQQVMKVALLRRILEQ